MRSFFFLTAYSMSFQTPRLVFIYFKKHIVNTTLFQKGQGMQFPFLAIFLGIGIFLAIRYKSLNKKQDEVTQSFWEREAAANAAPTANLDNIKYITIPLDKFPLGFSKDPAICSLENILRDLSKKRLLNLTGKTNTELKEAYGVANLTTMQSIGEDFDLLTITLKDYGAALIEQGLLADAINVLEFGVAIGTDISQNYNMLGDCYLALGKTDKISYLIEQVESRNLMLAPSILRHLRGLLSEDSTDGPVKTPENFEINKN